MTNQPPPPQTNIGPRAYAAAHFALELDDMKNIGVFRSIEGGGIKAEVLTYQNGGTYDRWRQLGKPKFEDLKLQIGMAMSQPFYDWIAQFFDGAAIRKDGAIVAADFYYKERARRKFTNAMIKEMTFPKLDAQDKNAAYMTVALAVEDIQFIKGEGTAIAVDTGGDAQKAWKACNFQLSMEGFDLKRVTKIESFTVKQNVLEYASGGNRWMSKTPSAIDFPQLSFSLPEADAQPLFAHFTRRGVKGEVPGRLHGQLEMFDNERATKFVIDFLGADILNVQPDKADASTEEIKQVKVDMYVESMTFTYKGDA